MLIRVALTGGIATGKSYVLRRFAERDVPTIDADKIAHVVTSGGAPAVTDIRRRFGSDVFDSIGEIDREELAQRVFDDPQDRNALEAIVHPRVRAAIDHWFADISTEDRAPFAIADIPLLFETGRQGDFDRVVVTTCPVSLQLDRLASRGLSVADAQKRIAAQLPSEEKLAGADFVIQTGESFAETDRQIDETYDGLCRGGRG
jgi:dephospho-CoA kinase